MKRLINNPTPNGGVPYQNSDFNDILQYQSAWLPFSKILDDILRTSDYGDQTKRGLILGGINVVGLTDSNTKIRVEFDNPIVYINGEALTGNYSGIVQTNPIWIYEAPSTYESRVLRNSTSGDVIINRTFTYSTSNPGTYSIYLGTYSNLNHIHNSLYQYINAKYDSNFFDKISFQQANTPSRSPFEQVTWNKPYISFMGSVPLSQDVVSPTYRVFVNIPNQQTSSYIVNGCILGADGAQNNASVGWAIEAKGATSFGLLLYESESEMQNLAAFQFTIVRSPDNTITTCSTYSYPP